MDEKIVIERRPTISDRERNVMENRLKTMGVWAHDESPRLLAQIDTLVQSAYLAGFAEARNSAG